MTDRIDINELCQELGPGDYDLSGETIIISDGNGNEIELELSEGSLEVSTEEPVETNDHDVEFTMNVSHTYKTLGE